MKSAGAAAFLTAVVVALFAGPALAPASSPADEYVEHEPSAGGSIDFGGGGGEEEEEGPPAEQPEPATHATPVIPAPTSGTPAGSEGSERGGEERDRGGKRKRKSDNASDRARREPGPAQDARVSISPGAGEEGLGSALASLIGTGPGGIGPLLPLLGLGTLAAIAIAMRRGGRTDPPERRE